MVKKVSDRTSRSEIAERKVIAKLIKENKWDPFKRVDPKVLEIIHRQSSSKRVDVLEGVEDALI
jgi:hypothetical protein